MGTTPYAPPHNLNALLIGTGEFSFALGATTLAAAAIQGFRDFGNVKAFQIDGKGEDKTHYGSYRGITRKDDMRKQKLELGYKLTCDEWTASLLRFLFFGTPSGVITRAAIAAVAGTVLPFSNGSPSQNDLFYDVMDATGNRARELTAVTFQGKQEGTDFEVDYRMGRVRFLSPQVTALTPTITAAAINAGDPGSLYAMQPLSQNIFNGIGRLVLFDEGDPQNIVLEHTDFGCQVEISGTPDVKSDDYSDLALMVSVSAPVGTTYFRNA